MSTSDVGKLQHYAVVLSVGKESTPRMQVMQLTVDFKVEEDPKTHHINYGPEMPELIAVGNEIVGDSLLARDFEEMRNIIGEMVVAAHNIIQAQPALASTLPAIVPVFYVDPSKDESLADNIEFAAHSSGSDGEYWFRIAKPNDDSGGYDWVYPEVAEAHHAMQEEFQPEFGGTGDYTPAGFDVVVRDEQTKKVKITEFIPDPTKPEYYRVTVHDDSTKDPDFKLISEVDSNSPLQTRDRQYRRYPNHQAWVATRNFDTRTTAFGQRCGLTGGGLTNAKATDINDTRYAVIIDAGSSGSKVYIYRWKPRYGNRVGNQIMDLIQIGTCTGKKLVLQELEKAITSKISQTTIKATPAEVKEQANLALGLSAKELSEAAKTGTVTNLQKLAEKLAGEKIYIAGCQNLESGGCPGGKDCWRLNGIATIPATDGDSKRPDEIRKRVEHHLKPLVHYAEGVIIDYVRKALLHDAHHLNRRGINSANPWDSNTGDDFREATRLFNIATGSACRNTAALRASLFIGGTGGMRALEAGRRSRLHKGIEDFLVNPRRFLTMKYHTIPGIAEGIYGWAAANYAKTKDGATFGRDTIKGYIEMGGQTMQIALNCGIVTNEAPAIKGDGFRDITIGGIKYNVFAHEWGDRGADARWRRHLHVLYALPNMDITPADKIAKERLNPQEPENTRLLKDNCLPKGAWDPRYPNGYSGTSNFTECIKDCLALVACRGYVQLEQHAGHQYGCLIQSLPAVVPKDKVAGVRAWVGGANFWYGAQGVFANPDGQYQPIRLMHEANLVHNRYKQREPAMPEANRPHLWRAVFNAVYTSLTLHMGFGIRLKQQARGDATTAVTASDHEKLNEAMLEQLNTLTTTADNDDISSYTIVDPDKQPWALGAALIQIHDSDCIQDLLERYKPSL